MSEIETISREDFQRDLAWLAGFIDGEGSITVDMFGTAHNNNGDSWKHFSILITITNTHADSIEKATRILSELGCIFHIQVRKRKNDKHKPCMAVNLCGQGTSVKLLKVLLPYLSCKQELAKQAIYAYEYRKNLTRTPNNQWQYNRSQSDRLRLVKRAEEIGAKQAAKEAELGWSSIYRWKKEVDAVGEDEFLAKNPVDERMQDDTILLAMIQRSKELMHWRPDVFAYSRKPSQKVSLKKPSESIRLTAISADDVLRSSVRAEESGRNVQTLAA